MMRENKDENSKLVRSFFVRANWMDFIDIDLPFSQAEFNRFVVCHQAAFCQTGGNGTKLVPLFLSKSCLQQDRMIHQERFNG